MFKLIPATPAPQYATQGVGFAIIPPIAQEEGYERLVFYRGHILYGNNPTRIDIDIVAYRRKKDDAYTGWWIEKAEGGEGYEAMRKDIAERLVTFTTHATGKDEKAMTLLIKFGLVHLPWSNSPDFSTLQPISTRTNN